MLVGLRWGGRREDEVLRADNALVLFKGVYQTWCMLRWERNGVNIKNNYSPKSAS